MDAFVALISNTGFPIACVVALGWFVKWMYEQNNSQEAAYHETINKMLESHAKETAETREAYIKLSNAIDNLTARIDRLDGGKTEE